MNRLLAALAAIAMADPAAAQQVPDRDYRPVISSPSYAEGAGPVVCLDEAHHNFHTLDNRFRAFGDLLRRDGYVVRPIRDRFESTSLASCGVLVISNAQPGDAPWNTYPYPTPAAFTPDEVAAVHSWVSAGGSLLLIADHMPLAGAAASLAAAFDVTFLDGFAVDIGDQAGLDVLPDLDAAFGRPTIFVTSDSTLRPHPIVRGRSSAESVTSIRTFTGQAFRAPDHAEPLLVLSPSFISLMSRVAWQFTPDTERRPVGGWLQGAVMEVGTGRAAFFGEAAMFSAQVAGAQRNPMGMNAPGAEQNHRFVLNLMDWLSRP